MNTLDIFLDTEEFITAEEYIRRRDAGLIDVSKVRYALKSPVKGQIGGFYVKLDTPRYRVGFPAVCGYRHAR